MRFRRFSCVLACVLFLSGCNYLLRTIGLTEDENADFTVVTHPLLGMPPPAFTLPRPGSDFANVQELSQPMIGGNPVRTSQVATLAAVRAPQREPHRRPALVSRKKHSECASGLHGRKPLTTTCGSSTGRAAGSSHIARATKSCRAPTPHRSDVAKKCTPRSGSRFAYRVTAQTRVPVHAGFNRAAGR